MATTTTPAATTKIPADKEQTFEVKAYDVTDPGCQLLMLLTCPFHFLPLCPGAIGKKTLTLEEEETYYEVRGGLCAVNTRRPYGEIGSVDKINCLCCDGVSSSIFPNYCPCIFPGWGADRTKVDEIVSELKVRMKSRGDTGQIQKTEIVLEEIKSIHMELGELKADMRKVMQALNVPQAEAPMERS